MTKKRVSTKFKGVTKYTAKDGKVTYQGTFKHKGQRERKTFELAGEARDWIEQRKAEVRREKEERDKLTEDWNRTFLMTIKDQGVLVIRLQDGELSAIALVEG